MRPHCRGNSAYIRQSRPDSGRGFQAKALKPYEDVPSSLGNGVGFRVRVSITKYPGAHLAGKVKLVLRVGATRTSSFAEPSFGPTGERCCAPAFEQSRRT